ncbi:MAG: hypothetical protein D6732_17230, partial [Methanobacteriota archaeon]
MPAFNNLFLVILKKNNMVSLESQRILMESYPDQKSLWRNPSWKLSDYQSLKRLGVFSNLLHSSATPAHLPVGGNYRSSAIFRVWEKRFPACNR